MRAYLDLIAYGSHYPTCRLHETVATNRPHLPDLHPHPCSCGFKDAVDKAQRAAQPAPDPEAIRLLVNVLEEAEPITEGWFGNGFDPAHFSALRNRISQARSFLSRSEARESGGEA